MKKYNNVGLLINQMFDIINNDLISYKSDFTKYDIPNLFKAISKNQSINGYLFTRQTGTHLLIKENFDNLNDLLSMFDLYQSYNDKIYYFDSESIVFNEIWRR